MSSMRRHALIASLLDQMCRSDSWAGRTHIQKTLYVFQKLFHPGEEWEFQYLLYKHGPYSFELDEELAEMEFYGGIERVEQRPYGPRYRTLEGATEKLVRKYGTGVDHWSRQLQFVAQRVSTKTVRELEALCTLLHVATDGEESRQFPTRTDQIDRVRELKPHLTGRELETAYDELLSLQAAAPAGQPV